MDLSFLKTALPTIVTALGGPAAGLAVNFLADKLGLSEKTVDAVKTAIAGATPEQLIAMKQLDTDLEKHFADLGVRLEELEIADRASARDREVKASDSWTPRILAFAITAGFFGTLGYLLAYGKPADGGDALLVMLGSLGTAWAGVVNYYFGSTKSSADKTAMLARAQPIK